MATAQEWAWFQSRTKTILCEDMMGMVAYNEEGTMVAACVADSFGPDNCNVHMAIDSPMVLRRGFLSGLADWLFIQNNRKRVFGLVPSNNSKALKFNAHIGFQEVARVPNAVAEGVDYVVLSMGRDDCRWFKEIKEAA
jgi:hypothetical protein